MSVIAIVGAADLYLADCVCARVRCRERNAGFVRRCGGYYISDVGVGSWGWAVLSGVEHWIGPWDGWAFGGAVRCKRAVWYGESVVLGAKRRIRAVRSLA